MRRVLVAAVALFTLAACSDEPPQAAVTPSPGASGSASASASPSATASPPPPADAAVTAQVCTDASKAVTDASKFFTDQMVVLEKAAARGDQDAVVAAANAVQNRLTTLGATVSAYAAKAVSPELRKALVDAATALTEISSQEYAGTQADIKKKLNDLVAAFAKVCG